MDISEFIKEESVIFADKKDKSEVLKEMIQKAIDLGVLTERDAFKKAIDEREAVISTGIGLGAAFPHAKIKSIENFFIITAILKYPVDWDSFDQKPVNIVFLIGGPEGKQKEYLKILSSLMFIVKNNEKREAVIKAKTTGDVIAAFKNAI